MTDISKLIEIGYAKPIENLEHTKGFKGYWVLKNGKIWSEPRAGSKGGFLKAQKCGPTKKDPTKKEYLFVKLFIALLMLIPFRLLVNKIKDFSESSGSEIKN